MERRKFLDRFIISPIASAIFFISLLAFVFLPLGFIRIIAGLSASLSLIWIILRHQEFKEKHSEEQKD